MDAQDGDFCGRMFAEYIHPVFASAKRRPAAIAESKRKSSAGRKKAEKADEKAQIHVGARMVIKRQKAEGSSWATTQYSSLEIFIPKM